MNRLGNWAWRSRWRWATYIRVCRLGCSVWGHRRPAKEVRTYNFCQRCGILLLTQRVPCGDNEIWIDGECKEIPPENRFIIHGRPHDQRMKDDHD